MFKYKKNFIVFNSFFNFFNKRLDKIVFNFIPIFSRYKIKELLIIIYRKIIFLNTHNIFFKIYVLNFLYKNILYFKEKYVFIIYEDNDIIVINKPYGIVIHPNINIFDLNLINFLLYYYGKKIIHLFRFGLVYRLDKNSTGLIIISKSKNFYLNFINQTKLNLVHKYYFAFLFGKFNYLLGNVFCYFRDNSKILNKKIFSKTKFFLVNIFFLEKFFISSLKFSLLTGRTNQLRLNFLYLNNHILYDFFFNKFYLYDKFFILNRLALHCYSIFFFNPILKLNFSFVISVFKDMQNLNNYLKKHSFFYY